MKRLGSSNSLGAPMSICPSTEEQNSPNSHVYSREFQSMLDGLDEEGCLEESGHIPEKKRRLSVDQVKALEKNFEVENKLEPERKVKLAQELGLQPRQVAVWFQNRRARWKTKQLERDYGVLKANYDSLKHNLEALQNDNEALMEEIRKLKSKINEENTESNLSVTEKETLASESDNPTMEPITSAAAATATTPIASMAGSDLIHAQAMDFKDGPSDSDSSAILNEDNSPNTAPSNSSPPGGDSGFLQTHNHQLLIPSSSPTSSSFRLNCSSSPSPPLLITYFNLSSESSAADFLGGGVAQKSSSYQTQFVKMEEHNFLSEEACCNFFSEDQAPTLPWSSPESWP